MQYLSKLLVLVVALEPYALARGEPAIYPTMSETSELKTFRLKPRAPRSEMPDTREADVSVPTPRLSRDLKSKGTKVVVLWYDESEWADPEHPSTLSAGSGKGGLRLRLTIPLEDK
ncbi:MAG: hypothetical protein AAB472_00390 [Patescibacteria group bacterium]